MSTSTWPERGELLRQGGWEEPEPGFADDGSALIGYDLFVQGLGKGRVLEFSKARVGTSTHVIEFESGGIQKVALLRKGNSKTPFLVLGPEVTEDRLGSGYAGDPDDEHIQGHGNDFGEDDLAGDEEDLDGDDTEDDDDDDDDDERSSDENDGRYPLSIRRTRSEEWEGVDDPGYVRIPVLDGLMPFGHEEEREEPPRHQVRIPEGWETAISRSTGKTYFINTITGDSQYEFPAGPAQMYASESDVSDMEDRDPPPSADPVVIPNDEAQLLPLDMPPADMPLADMPLADMPLADMPPADIPAAELLPPVEGAADGENFSFPRHNQEQTQSGGAAAPAAKYTDTEKAALPAVSDHPTGLHDNYRLTALTHLFI
jgi:hypothetical protein